MRARWAFAASTIVVAAIAVGAHRARRRVPRAHAPSPPVASTPERPPSRPEPPLSIHGARLASTRTILLDPGHGAADNRGNVGAFCVAEQDVMMDLAVDVARRLEETWNVRVILSREPGELVDYAARLRAGQAVGAEAFVSLHSDVRGHVERWSPAPELDCARADDSPGFSVLYSDEGEALVPGRRRLARAIAARMSGAGFLAYDGADYAGLYEPDAHGGVFIDRHAPAQRIYVLRRAAMPSVIVETHNALDPEEALRWRDPVTIDAFAASLASALHDVLEPDGTSGKHVENGQNGQNVRNETASASGALRSAPGVD